MYQSIAKTYINNNAKQLRLNCECFSLVSTSKLLQETIFEAKLCLNNASDSKSREIRNGKRSLALLQIQIEYESLKEMYAAEIQHVFIFLKF